MILMEEDDKDHNVHPYKDRQYDVIKKHFTNGISRTKCAQNSVRLPIHVLDNSDDVFFVI